MKLVYLHQYFVFPTDSGGTRSYDLSLSFVEKGIDVEIITTSSFLNNQGTFLKGWNFLEKDGLKLHVLKLDYSNNLSYFRRTLVFFQFLWYSTFKLLSLNANIVLATSTPLTIGIPALIKKLIHKTPFVFEVRDVWPEAVIAVGAVKNTLFKKALYGLERLIYTYASAIVPLSSDMKASIARRYPRLMNKPVVVIENISEVNRFQTGYSLQESYLKRKLGFKPIFSVLYAGTFGKVNGISYVIDLAVKVSEINPDIIFVLVGSGTEKEMIVEMAKKVGVLEKNVFFLNPVSKSELPQLYSEISMGSSFVIPVEQLWANSANKFFDTLAAGRPILINHGGWQKEVIEDENIGYVLPTDLATSEDIEKFIEYTQNITLIKEQERLALKTATEKYALDIASCKYISVFMEIGFV